MQVLNGFFVQKLTMAVDDVKKQKTTLEEEAENLKTSFKKKENETQALSKELEVRTYIRLSLSIDIHLPSDLPMLCCMSVHCGLIVYPSSHLSFSHCMRSWRR